jgi:glycosyl transferase family 2
MAMKFRPNLNAARSLETLGPTSAAQTGNRPRTGNKSKAQTALRNYAAGARRRLRALAANVRAQAHELAFPQTVEWVSGSRRVGAAEDEFVVVCLVRDGAIYVPEFLRHYRELGAKHIVLLDNGSTDGTPGLVTREPDVTVMRTTVPYKIYKDIMKRWLVTRFGRHNWVLCVDIDELFDYPFRREIKAANFLRYLNRYNFSAVVAQMLDLFPQGTLLDHSTQAWRAEHRFYSLRDLDRCPYSAFYKGRNTAPPVGLDVIRGGIRLSVFQVRATLTKHPLLFPSRGVTYLQAHHVSSARVADLSGVLLHYKFVGDFASYVRTVVKAESFWMNSEEYKQYLRAIETDPALSLYSETALEFSTVERLVDQGFLTASDQFRAEIARQRGGTSWSRHSGTGSTPNNAEA